MVRKSDTHSAYWMQDGQNKTASNLTSLCKFIAEQRMAGTVKIQKLLKT